MNSVLMLEPRTEAAQIPDWLGEVRVRPRASIIIVSYNSRDDLRRCLSSVCDAGVEQDEVIVVDNASTDGSAALVAEAFPCVRVIANGTNGGFSHGNNMGVRHAAGEYLVFLNPDTSVEPGWQDALIQVLAADPGVGLATAQILQMNAPDRVNARGNDVHLTGLTLCRGLASPRDDAQDAHEVTAVSGAACAIRRDLFQRLGGFDESFFMYMEDTDLSWRARLAGYRCVCAPASVVYHDYTLRFGPQKIFYQERNRYLMLLKTMRRRTLLALAPALMMGEIVAWSFTLLHDRAHWTNKLSAYRYLVRHREEIGAARRSAQATRAVEDRDLLRVTRAALEYDQAVPGSVAARLASLIIDPIFAAWRQFALAVVRW